MLQLKNLDRTKGIQTCEMVTRRGATKPSAARRECILASIILSVDRLDDKGCVLVKLFLLEDDSLVTDLVIKFRIGINEGGYLICALPESRHSMTWSHSMTSESIWRFCSSTVTLVYSAAIFGPNI